MASSRVGELCLAPLVRTLSQGFQGWALLWGDLGRRGWGPLNPAIQPLCSASVLSA